MKNSIILILVIGMVALLYSFNNKEENQTEIPSEKRFLITPPPQWIEDDSLNISKLLIDKTDYYKNKGLEKLFFLDSYYLEKRNYFFLDNENILVVLDYVGYKTPSGKEILKGGIYKINIKNKTVELFDSLPFERAKKEKLIVCSDGLRILTNNKYKSPNNKWYNITDEDYPFKGYELKNEKYHAIDACFPILEKSTYTEYKDKIINRDNQVYKLNNNDLFVNYKFGLDKNKKNTYSLIYNDEVIHEKHSNYKYANWNNQVYWTNHELKKYSKETKKEIESCYGIKYLELGTKNINNILLCNGADYRIQNHPIRSKEGLIFFRRNGSFLDGGNLALYKENKKFDRYLVDKKRRANIRNFIVSSDGCGLIYMERIKNKYQSIKYKNICLNQEIKNVSNKL